MAHLNINRTHAEAAEALGALVCLSADAEGNVVGGTFTFQPGVTPDVEAATTIIHDFGGVVETVGEIGIVTVLVFKPA